MNSSFSLYVQGCVRWRVDWRHGGIARMRYRIMSEMGKKSKMSDYPVRPYVQTYCKALRLAEVNCGDVFTLFSLDVFLNQWRVYWLSETKIKREGPAYVLTYFFAAKRSSFGRMRREGEKLYSAATLRPKSELQFCFSQFSRPLLYFEEKFTFSNRYGCTHAF